MSVPSNNVWFAVSLGLIGVIGGYLLGGGIIAQNNSASSAPRIAQAPVQPQPEAQPQPPPPQPAGDVRAPDDSDYIRGNKDALISVIEYSDLECPFCKRVHPTLQQLVNEYGGKVNWVYRHFPLGFHTNARPAAIASECVNELGGIDDFWAFVDTIFETQGEWDYEKYVTDLGLGVSAFNDCVKSGKHGERVDDQLAEGSAAGVRGTPGNFVYNNKTGDAEAVSGAQPIENFKAVIDRMLDS